ncbi:MAG: L-aspartate oxidase [Crocinitomix sp.]|nr:L-aspartate oxidase [Crocinitomix sp.]
MKTDFLVIGSGIAGLTYGIKISEKFPDKKVLIVTKNHESNTQFAQGGVAIVQNDTDSFNKHYNDTILAGDGLCDEKIVKMVISEGPKCLSEMVDWGVQFDLKEGGRFDLRKEGGHSENRVVHYKDITGAEISRAMLLRLEKLENITFLSNHFVLDLISDHHLKSEKSKNEITCYGCYALNEENNQTVTIQAKITLMATGGIGQVYGHTTNPNVATGDGIAMAYRIGAKIKEIEFVQFHPTVLYAPSSQTTFLISEAVRGFGAKLKNESGEEFIYRYDSRGALASRDIVARAIDAELKNTGKKCVYLDCTELDPIGFSAHFPTITETCRQNGINVHKDLIPVIPAAHYGCGGIQVNKDAESSIQNLFACGECAQTGLHGANRLASNSLLEAFVFADKAVEKSAQLIGGIELPVHIPDWNDKGTVLTKEKVLISHNRVELQQIMQNYVGIVRSNTRLERALKRIELLYEETETLYKLAKISNELCELRNMISAAYLIITHSQRRKENRGGFYNIDLI